MTTLTDPQHALLTSAAAAEDACAVRPEDITDAKWKAATRSLVKGGWLISVPLDGGGSSLLITDAGRAQVAPPPKAKTPKAAKAAGPIPPADEGDRPAEPEPTPKGKIGVLVGLLRRDGGATITDMMAATGWQAHSVRGAMSGSVKKALGLMVTSDKTDTGRVYRIVEAA
jgi:hypothetical protein